MLGPSHCTPGTVAEPPMTDEMIEPSHAREKTPDANLLREMTAFAARRFMEVDVRGLLGCPTARSAQLEMKGAT